jgi:hypothetical protein
MVLRSTEIVVDGYQSKDESNDITFPDGQGSPDNKSEK